MDDLDDVGFLYKTMLTRDPKKRQVKPVQPHMVTLDFGGLDDSEDDDDYKLPQGKKGSDDEDDDDDDDTGDTPSDNSDDDEGSSEDGENDDDRKEDLSVSRLSDEASMVSERNESVMDSEVTLGDIMTEDGERSKTFSGRGDSISPSEHTFDTMMYAESASKRPMKVLICSVCLQDFSEGDDEIVECDGCGVAVHEGCYGMADNQSVASTESSASTEPWFCDACKAGVKPYCELCPNSGGIYKETDAGRWVHLVCALYVPGVAFGDIDKLNPVTLFEMPYSKWGAKECTLCEDVRFSRTGVCICCDAGMCRNYFHVTCAQKQGLLTEAMQEEEIADPFYAHCKQHVDKMMMKIKRRNWLALQSQTKSLHEQDNNDELEKARVKRKLERHRRKFLIAKANRPPCWIPKEKMPRMLTTNPSALRKLMRKAELLGINTQNQNTISQTDVSKKWHLPAAFSVEFVSYYMDRNERIDKMRAHQKDLIATKEKLQSHEKIQRAKYEKLTATANSLKKKYEKIIGDGNKLWNCVTSLSKKKLKVPSYLKPQKVVTKASVEERSVPAQPVVINQCGLCKGTQDQHLLAKCDTCKLFYHLGCLDPPLTRMPKKTKLYGWQCSECMSSGSSDSDVSVDTSAPMRLRETIKEPKKFSLAREEENAQKLLQLKKKKKKTKKKPQKKVADDNNELDDTSLEVKSPPLKKARPTPPPKVKKEVDVRTGCSQCGRPGDNSTLVRCDECKDCFHFQCLDPPMKSTPKQRGYGWVCSKCSPDDTDEDMEEAEKEEEEQEKSFDHDTVEESVDDSYDMFAAT